MTWITYKQAQEMTGFSYSTLRNYKRLGLIETRMTTREEARHGTRINHKVLINLESLKNIDKDKNETD